MAERQTQTQRRVIDANNLIPLGHLAVLMTICVGGALWAQDITQQLEGLTRAVEGLTESRWTFDDQRHWIELLRLSNPDDTIPEATRFEGKY